MKLNDKVRGTIYNLEDVGSWFHISNCPSIWYHMESLLYNNYYVKNQCAQYIEYSWDSGVTIEEKFIGDSQEKVTNLRFLKLGHGRNSWYHFNIQNFVTKYPLVFWISSYPQDGGFGKKKIPQNYNILKGRIFFIIWSKQWFDKDFYTMSLGAAMNYIIHVLDQHVNATFEHFDRNMEVMNSCFEFFISILSHPLVEEHVFLMDDNGGAIFWVWKNMLAMTFSSEPQIFFPLLTSQ